MKKFTVREIKEKFMSEVMNNHLVHVEIRLSQNESLSDTFYDFSQKEGFELSSIISSANNFNFSAHLLDEHNSENNNGQMVFSRADFERAVYAKKKELEKSIAKPVPSLTAQPKAAKKEQVKEEVDPEEQDQD